MTDDQSRDPRYDSTRQTWETIWQGASVESELAIAQSERAQEAIQAYLPYLPQDDLILEAGSGLSAVVITLRRLGYRVIGLDYAINALHISRQYQPDLPLLAGDVHALPHPDNSLGAYLSFGVLEHFEGGMQPALREAYRVLKPGGTLILTIPYPNVVYRLVQWRRSLTGASPLTDDDFYESAYTRADLVNEAERAGFTVLATIPTSHAFTLWGLGGPFRAAGYYQTTPLADQLGRIAKQTVPWALNFMTLLIGRK